VESGFGGVSRGYSVRFVVSFQVTVWDLGVFKSYSTWRVVVELSFDVACDYAGEAMIAIYEGVVDRLWKSFIVC